MLESILNYGLAFFSTILQMNLRDHHDIPFALPLVAASMVGFIVGFTILKFIGNEERDNNIADEQQNQG